MPDISIIAVMEVHVNLIRNFLRNKNFKNNNTKTFFDNTNAQRISCEQINNLCPIKVQKSRKDHHHQNM